MAEEQGIKSLKLQNRRKRTFYPVDWIAGVDYNNKNNDHDDEADTEFENEENNNVEYEDDDAIEEEENFDRVDQQEIDEILADTTKKEEANPTDMEDNEAEEQQEEEAQEDDAQEDPEQEPNQMPEPEAQPERVQPPRNRQAPERLTYAQSKGKEKHVKFDINVNPEDVEEYNQQYAMLIAKCMAEINAKATMYGSCYGQQYILQKGLKKFKKAGEDAAGKELEQLHKRNCFTPMDVTKLSPEEKKKQWRHLCFSQKRETNQLRDEWFIMASLLENGYREKTPRARLLHWKV
ncbi:hypothetical protein [Athalassotoga sp.]|uniref:hypothetical protein n=1 Tax=Athalassotoga sp. TaxID=2022597 RepID=UPI003D08204F